MNDEKVIDITDTDYFYMLDNQIRPSMMRAESEVFLPLAKSFLYKSGVQREDLTEFPTEGYYYETPQLRNYFKIIRNLQHNKEVIKKLVDCDELETLKRVCNNDLFGIEDPGGRGGEGPLKRRYDILTLTMEDPSLAGTGSPRPWSIQNIMDGVSKKYKNRVNLVELAYLTKDPRPLCCGAETNSLYRMIACCSGSASGAAWYGVDYVWKVSPDVEDLGRRIANAYNALLEGDYVKAPTLENHIWYKKIPKVPRVALLGYVLATKEYYHWILTSDMELEEMYCPNIITTESYEKGVAVGNVPLGISSSVNWTNMATEFKGNIFNATPAV